MKTEKFYRVANTETNQGLWYDMSGNFTGLIHGKFNFCSNNSLEMPFDKSIVGWISATETLEELFMWFTINDILMLEKFGYKICEYETESYKIHLNHKVIEQSKSKFVRFIELSEILEKQQ